MDVFSKLKLKGVLSQARMNAMSRVRDKVGQGPAFVTYPTSSFRLCLFVSLSKVPHFLGWKSVY